MIYPGNSVIQHQLGREIQRMYLVLSSILPLVFQAPSNQPSRAIVNQANMADKEKTESDSFLKSICKYPLGHE